MRNKRRMLLAALGVLALMLAPVRRATGDDSDHKATLHRADCSAVVTATDNVGFAIFEVDEDDDIQIEVSLKRGMPNTEYRAYVLTAPCHVALVDDVLRTNKKGKGNRHIMVPSSAIPPGSEIAVQLVSPPGAVVPGPGPFKDVITSNFVTPRHDEN